MSEATIMNGFYLFFTACFLFCLAACISHASRLIRGGKTKDYSPPKGDPARGVAYAFTGAMHPGKKESAYLHLPTYAAGLGYHLGTFISLALLFLVLPAVSLPRMLAWVLASVLAVSSACGAAILVKRVLKKGLRALSSPDDYLSNLLVTLFQTTTALVLLRPELLPAYIIAAGMLLLWMPLGKLKHAIYFFAARYHLGSFFGWRGVWPPKQI